MFTGIITDIGTIRSIEQRGDLHIVIGTSYDPATIAMGASIACSGVCLTVVDKGADEQGGWFAVDVSGETVSRTAGAMWQERARLNLERALKLGDELGGHIVTGHVDGIGEVESIDLVGGSRRVEISVPAVIAPYMAPKGSITVDGVSLTVNNIADRQDGSTRIGLNIIPHTAEVTTLNALKSGQSVNLEIDVMARYLSRLKDYQAAYS